MDIFLIIGRYRTEFVIYNMIYLFTMYPLIKCIMLGECNALNYFYHNAYYLLWNNIGII